MTIDLTPTQRDEMIRTLHGTLPGSALAKRVGLSASQLYRAVARLGLSRHAERRQHAAMIRQVVLTLAARPDGMRAVEAMPLLPNTTAAAIEACMVKLKARGMLHSVPLTYRTVRYFSSLAGASAYERRHAPKFAAPVTISQTHGRGPAHLPGEPVVTSRTRITIAPTPPRALWTNTHMVAG